MLPVGVVFPDKQDWSGVGVFVRGYKLRVYRSLAAASGLGDAEPLLIGDDGADELCPATPIL